MGLVVNPLWFAGSRAFLRWNAGGCSAGSICMNTSDNDFLNGAAHSRYIPCNRCGHNRSTLHRITFISQHPYFTLIHNARTLQ